MSETKKHKHKKDHTVPSVCRVCISQQTIDKLYKNCYPENIFHIIILPMNNPQHIIDALQWRYATKQFDPEKTIDQKTLHVLLESLRMAPSSFGLQPWKFIVITNDELKKKLRAVSFDQAQITDCSHLVVHCALREVTAERLENYFDFMVKTRNQTRADIADFENMVRGFIKKLPADFISEWMKRQTYISQGFLMMAAADLQVDACPMEGFSPADYDSTLELSDTLYTSTLVTALGYRHEDDRHASHEKVRFPREDVFTFLQ